MDKVVHAEAVRADTAGIADLDELLNRLHDLVANVTVYVSCLGEEVAFASIDEVVSRLAFLAYADEALFARVRQYCALRVAPIVAESHLARLIAGEGSNNAKGSHLVMENIWGASRCDADKYVGTTRRGELLNAYNCRSDNARANVARIEWFTYTLASLSGADVAALGSGSAIEIREHLAHQDNANRFHVFDQCQQACESARSIIRPDSASRLEATCGNPIVGLIRSRKSYDLIYSLGMLDYFDENDSVALIGKLLSRTKDGGMVLLGNARPESRTRLWLELMGGWNLNYKSDTKMHEIGRLAASGHPCQIWTDSFGVYNFLKIIKE